jgi:pyridinium-3,5-bisthiocarboxylic acid mononucleotide nickel chelatase
MTTLLIDMPSGIAGDMLVAGLVALGGDLARAERDLAALAIGPIRLVASTVSRSGITAIQVDVLAEQRALWKVGLGGAKPTASIEPHAARAPAQQESHPHRPYRDIKALLARAALPERVRDRAQRVFRVLAEAEGSVHGVAADEVEFHEVGAVDAIADVVGCCLLLEQLGIDRVIAGPLLPGEGYVMCAHGRMPVPVPAVAAMLAASGAPHRRLGRETGELTTPTGCALVTALTERYLDGVTTFTARKTGYGAGHKEFADLANVLRVSLVDEQQPPETITEIRCQVDDATGEELAFLLDELMAQGARDAHLTPIMMKKGRPGFAITVLCDEALREKLSAVLLSRSPTIGVRYQQLARDVLARRSASVSIQGYTIALKIVTTPAGHERAKAEADDVAAAARALQLPFAEIQRLALRAFEDGRR